MATCPPVETGKGGHFGAPRSGDRKHEGCDFSTLLGTPLFNNVPMTVTRIDRVNAGPGGRAVYMKDANNREYYFAHLDAIPKDLKIGLIPAGTKFATTGNSGVTETGKAHTTHLHFESWQNGIHLKTGVKVDPESVDPLTGKQYLNVATYQIDPVTKQPIGNLRTACRVPEKVEANRPPTTGPVAAGGVTPPPNAGAPLVGPASKPPVPAPNAGPVQAPTNVLRNVKGIRINPLQRLGDK